MPINAIFLYIAICEIPLHSANPPFGDSIRPTYFPETDANSFQ
jgi:hypothetical protein